MLGPGLQHLGNVAGRPSLLCELSGTAAIDTGASNDTLVGGLKVRFPA